MRCCVLLLLLVSLPSLAARKAAREAAREEWNHFQFDITFFCNFEDRRDYDLKIQWWESDTSSGYDELTKPSVIRPSVGRYSFSMVGAMNGDEILSDGYHPVAYMSHDCTSDRKRVDFVLDITTLCVIGQTCHYRIIHDLTNVWGKEKMEASNYKAGNLDDFPDFP
uniref:Conserved secreted protein n=1 Tax=Caenorhabditis tropicalis TaxID=1561998 RepID=A0A1I7UNH8_9PELO